MIRATIGLDASTFGEEAVAKDFSLQIRIANNDTTVLDTLEKQIEQFVRDPTDVLARILNKKGLDWIQRIAQWYKSNKNCRFTDEENFYWRSLNLSTDETRISPQRNS